MKALLTPPAQRPSVTQSVKESPLRQAAAGTTDCLDKSLETLRKETRGSEDDNTWHGDVTAVQSALTSTELRRPEAVAAMIAQPLNLVAVAKAVLLFGLDAAIAKASCLLLRMVAESADGQRAIAASCVKVYEALCCAIHAAHDAAAVENALSALHLMLEGAHARWMLTVVEADSECALPILLSAMERHADSAAGDLALHQATALCQRFGASCDQRQGRADASAAERDARRRQLC